MKLKRYLVPVQTMDGGETSPKDIVPVRGQWRCCQLIEDEELRAQIKGSVIGTSATRLRY